MSSVVEGICKARHQVSVTISAKGDPICYVYQGSSPPGPDAQDDRTWELSAQRLLDSCQLLLSVDEGMQLFTHALGHTSNVRVERGQR